MNQKVQLSLLFALFWAATASGCGCIQSPNFTLTDEVTSTDLLFKGKVSNIEVVFTDSIGSIKVKEQKVTLQILHFYQAACFADSSEITLMTGIGGGDCGYFFEKGKSYFVFANFTEFPNQAILQLRTNICTATQEYSTDFEKAINRSLDTIAKKYPIPIQYYQSRFTFKGKVKTVDTLTIDTDKLLATTFRIQYKYQQHPLGKGRKITIYTPLGSEECIYPFEKGKSYIVFTSMTTNPLERYADKPKFALTTPVCRINCLMNSCIGSSRKL